MRALLLYATVWAQEACTDTAAPVGGCTCGVAPTTETCTEGQTCNTDPTPTCTPAPLPPCTTAPAPTNGCTCGDVPATAATCNVGEVCDKTASVKCAAPSGDDTATDSPGPGPNTPNRPTPTVREIRDICSCGRLTTNVSNANKEYRCLDRGAMVVGGDHLWPQCKFQDDECSSVGSDDDNPLYQKVEECVATMTTLQTLVANKIGDAVYDDLRCCLANQDPEKREACARFVCMERYLLQMPFICQTEFFLEKDTQCRLGPKLSVLRDCHRDQCSISLLKFESKYMFYLLIAAAISTCLCAFLAVAYIKRKKRRMLEWAILEDRVMGGMGGEGGKDDLLDMLAQKERRARVWYYVSKQGKVVGPLKEEDMRLRKVAGLFDDDLMVRCNNSDWKTLAKLYANPELEAFEAKTRPNLGPSGGKGGGKGRR